MLIDNGAIDPQSFTTFGALLRYLRRRAMLTQRDLGIAIGYSEGHINRFEKNKYLPDPAAVASLFVPALDLTNESALAARLMELASAPTSAHSRLAWVGEPIPPAPPHEITRAQTLVRARTRLADERHLILCGLPGIGKTTLASTLARESAVPVFWLTLTEGITTSADVWIYRLAQFLLAQGQSQVEPLVAVNKLSFEQQMALLGAALAQQPALLCFDNAEVIRQNDACLQVLHHLSATTPAYLLITTRESLPLTKIAEATIDGFDRDEALTFIAQNSDHTLDERQAARLVDKTGGNPMLLHLAMGQLREHPADAETFIAHLQTQPQVASYLLQTFQTQSSLPGWRLLLLLAVFQQPVDMYDPYLVQLVETLGGIENIAKAIEELQRRHLVGDAATARLHPFVREYIYRTLSTQPTLRERLHRLAGDWFKGRDVATAALHYSRAGLPEEALDCMEENRDVIRARGQALSAVTILDEVRPQIKRLRANQEDLLRRLLTLRGVLLMNTLRTQEGENDLREAIALAVNPAVRATIICELAQLTSRRKDYAETLRLVAATRAELAPKDLLLHARLAYIEAASHRASGNQEESERKDTEALTLADQMTGFPQTIRDGIRARAHYGLATSANHRREVTTAMSHIQSALVLARTAHDVPTENICLNQIGRMLHEQGDLKASIGYLNQAAEGMLAIGDIHTAAYTLVNIAYNHFFQGKNDLALEKAEQACNIFRTVSNLSGLASAEEMRTDCLLWEGQIQEARHAMDRIMQEAEGPGTASLWGYRLRKFATIQLLQGESAAAIDTLRRALDLPTVRIRPMMRFGLYGTLAMALAVVGESDAAARALADAPPFEGLAYFAIPERDLIEGFVALARGDTETARKRADQVLQHAGEYPFYRQSANQLSGAIEQSAPVSAFPRLLWVRCP